MSFSVLGELSFGTKLAILVSIRSAGALLSHVTDCDEVFNYWEPLHYLVHGTGLQTWEYSPVYGLRSWLYLLPHAAPAYVLKLAGIDKATAFLVTRGLLGLLSAWCEASFCTAVKHSPVFGPLAANVAGVAFCFLAFSTGMFHASVALLPSSTSMYLCMASMTSWLNGNDTSAIFSIAVTTLLVWPFSGALGAPLAIDIVFHRQKLVFFVKCCVGCLVSLLPAAVAADSWFYQKTVFPAFNIVMYNVLSAGTSSELYGTEPWTFYYFNGFLNLNLAFVLGLLGPVVALVLPKDMSPFWTLAPMLVWFAIFFPQAHKEERFLFPVYPVICLSGAYALVAIEDVVSRKFPARLVRRAASAVIAAFVAISLSRSTAMYKGYHAPMDVYTEVSKLNPTGPAPTICVGKEWFRFSSSFFLPEVTERKGMSIEFIKSGYDGLLPKPFDAVNGTSVIPAHMNNMNEEEPTRYIDLASCDYVVDQTFPQSSSTEPNFKENADWDEVVCFPFLDPGRSHGLLRAFYVPTLSEKRTKFNDYCLHKRKE